MTKQQAIENCLKILQQAHYDIFQMECFCEIEQFSEASDVAMWFLKNIDGLIQGSKSYYEAD